MNKAEVFSYVICLGIVVILLIGVGVGIYEWRSYERIGKSLALLVQRKCDDYITYACKDLILNSHSLPSVPLRNEAIQGMFPHMAYLKLSTELAACSGTLISEYFILTAAHCVYNVKPDQIMVKLGSVFSSNDSTGAWFAVDQIHVHENFKDFSILHDIALLRMATKVELDRRIRPICLRVDNVDDDSKNGIVAAGWNLDETYTIAPEHLQILATNMDPPLLLDCREKWDQYYDKFVFCAGHPATRRSTCEINLGGPLQLGLKNGCANTYEQIGIASSNHDLNCTTDSLSTVIVTYTKVQAYIAWIANIVWPEK